MGSEEKLNIMSNLMKQLFESFLRRQALASNLGDNLPYCIGVMVVFFAMYRMESLI